MYIKIYQKKKKQPSYCQRPLTLTHPPHITITTKYFTSFSKPPTLTYNKMKKPPFMNIVSISFVLYKMYINFTFYILHKHTVHFLQHSTYNKRLLFLPFYFILFFLNSNFWSYFLCARCPFDSHMCSTVVSTKNGVKRRWKKGNGQKGKGDIYIYIYNKSSGIKRNFLYFVVIITYSHIFLAYWEGEGSEKYIILYVLLFFFLFVPFVFV